MTSAEIRELAVELDEEILFADGFDEALLGIGRRFNNHAAVYSTKGVIAVLVAQGMSEDDANEYFDFNIVGAYVGEHTPIFMLDE